MAYIIYQLLAEKSASDDHHHTAHYVSFTPDVIGNGEQSILFFHAAWCPHCQKHDALISEEELLGMGLHHAVYKVDYDTALDLRQRYGVTTQHTFVVIDGNGEKIDAIIGPSDEKLLELIGG